MINSILFSPVVTEKSIKHSIPGRYTFVVDTDADKDQIVAAVESQFKVKVVRVTTLIRKGRTKHVARSRRLTATTARKFATVTLKKGQTIPDMEVNE